MEACFHHEIKNKKGNCNIFSHNSDFFSSEFRDINSKLQVKKSEELCDIKSKLFLS